MPSLHWWVASCSHPTIATCVMWSLVKRKLFDYMFSFALLVEFSCNICMWLRVRVLLCWLHSGHSFYKGSSIILFINLLCWWESWDKELTSLSLLICHKFDHVHHSHSRFFSPHKLGTTQRTELNYPIIFEVDLGH